MREKFRLRFIGYFQLSPDMTSTDYRRDSRHDAECSQLAKRGETTSAVRGRPTRSRIRQVSFRAITKHQVSRDGPDNPIVRRYRAFDFRPSLQALNKGSVCPMSPDPINMNSSVTTPPPPEPPQSKDASSTASTADRSNDALMAALKRTLTRLGIDASTGLTTSDSFNDNADALSLPRRVSASSASLIAALYQALELQQSIALANGASISSKDSNDALSVVTDIQPSSSAVNGYRDLGAQIADLAKMSTNVASIDDTSTDEWDFDIDDSENFSSANTQPDDPMTSAIGQLNQALNDHVVTLAQSANAKVSLAAVLDGLSDETKGVQWRPLGVLIDVQA
ncbi:hypothetical protein [Paraburkholderia caribensis]|uniref:hypothetical protein n=1 Tax=Paraburkholderia caribensis TaxID=75105 RepID=UPI00285CB8F9|nr:hypothetical protein [Paraburkholderia caribensis]MDR6384644.1 hypothetical protein [Paraburkholderia caribensis]